MFDRKKRVRDALKALEAVAGQGQMERELSAIEPLRLAHRKLHAACEQLIRAGDTDRALNLLEVASASHAGVARHVWIMGLVIGLGAAGLAVAPQLFGYDILRGAAKATLTARTPACEDALTGALIAFQRDMGLAFELTGEEPAALFDDGNVELGYARDGARHGVSFRVERADEACQLVLWRRVTREPGSRQSRSGAFGTVLLPECACE